MYRKENVMNNIYIAMDKCDINIDMEFINRRVGLGYTDNTNKQFKDVKKKIFSKKVSKERQESEEECCVKRFK